MSDTPRTNAIIVDHPDDIGWTLDDFIGVVDARFARTLERELQTMTALAERLAEALDFALYGNTAKDQTPFRNASRKTLADYEAHKKQNSLKENLMLPCDCIEKCGDCWVLHCDCQNKDWMAEAKNWCEQQNKKQTP